MNQKSLVCFTCASHLSSLPCTGTKHKHKKKPYTIYNQQVCLLGGAFQVYRCSPQMQRAN